jgi:hypothetical protein
MPDRATGSTMGSFSSTQSQRHAVASGGPRFVSFRVANTIESQVASIARSSPIPISYQLPLFFVAVVLWVAG